MAEQGRRIALWSAPMTLAATLMRSFGNRPDTAVWDEPLYPYYLTATGAAHPGAEETIRTGETDWRRVVERILGPIPDGKAIWYLKLTSQHLLAEVESAWLDAVTNVFLIRSPREVIPALTRSVPQPRLEDTGLPHLADIFQLVAQRQGSTPAVIDARDLLRDPSAVLTRLCRAVEIPFTEAMLSWPAGPRATDGVWAKHSYQGVFKATTFEPYRSQHETVHESLNELLFKADELYHEMREHRLA